MYNVFTAVPVFKQYTAAECVNASIIPFVLFRAAMIISFRSSGCDISGASMSLSVPPVCLCRQCDCGYHVVGS